MKRDPHLHGLTLDHNHALILCTKLTKALAAGTFGAEQATALGRRFDEELDPHFRLEEELLLPALAAAGEHDLVQRTEIDHANLRGQLEHARAGDVEAAGTFARALRAHVRFEEHELFPAAEAHLSAEQLAEVLRRAPKTPREM